MSAIDAYASCPCGSGEKYKWCCQRAEPFVERSARLQQSGQIDAALKAVDEGLQANPDNPWLGLRKAVMLLRREDMAGAADTARRLAARHPKHPGIQSLHIQLVAQSDRPSVAAGHLQAALAAVPKERRAGLGATAVQLGHEFRAHRAIAAALAHYRLAMRLDPQLESNGTVAMALSEVESDRGSSLFQRNPYELSPVPPDLDEARAARFRAALAWVDEGRWADAAREFDQLSSLGTPESDRNLGLCRLWLGDHGGAVEALRRYTAWIGPTPDNIALEALCQEIEPLQKHETVEELQWIWPLRDRESLRSALQNERRLVPMGTRNVNPKDPDSPVVEMMAILDRPSLELDELVSGVTPPRVEGYLLVGQEMVLIEAFDDGRLDRLAGWFREFAGEAIPPAHPRTKFLSRAPRHLLALRAEWLLPKGADQGALAPVLHEAHVAFIRRVWPSLPLPALNGKTPAQAVGDKELALPLRAALLALEAAPLEGSAATSERSPFGLNELMNVPPEPAPDPATADPARLHLAYLMALDAEALDDERLVAAFRRATRFAILPMVYRAGTVITQRPRMFESRLIEPLPVYMALSSVAQVNNRPADALEYLSRGRAIQSPADRAQSAVHWDVSELRIRARSEAPEAWVPFLVQLMDRYRQSAEDNQVILETLLGMGLIEPVRDPDQPDSVYFDTQLLERLVTEYGPRITTATGELGVSAARNEIWTPGADAPGPTTGSGLWTPGGDQAGEAPGPSKLIIPGR